MTGRRRSVNQPRAASPAPARREEPARSKPASNRLSFKEKRELEELPARIEAYVTQPLAGIGVEDLLDDDPGGRLPSPAFISLHERLEEIGVEAPEVRQVPVLGEGGEVAAMEAVVTLEER